MTNSPVCVSLASLKRSAAEASFAAPIEVCQMEEGAAWGARLERKIDGTSREFRVTKGPGSVLEDHENPHNVDRSSEWPTAKEKEGEGDAFSRFTLSESG